MRARFAAATLPGSRLQVAAAADAGAAGASCIARGLAVAGAELLYPEQYHLADKHIIVDTARARRDLNWKPQHDDLSMMIAAYEHWRKRA